MALANKQQVVLLHIPTQKLQSVAADLDGIQAIHMALMASCIAIGEFD